MFFSFIYHTFSCRSEKDYDCFLTYDLLGIALSLLAIYLSGIYYAFWCHPQLRYFYSISVAVIFVIAIVLQVPRLNVSPNIKIVVFVSWAAYGIVPTTHWTVLMGGLHNPIVKVSMCIEISLFVTINYSLLLYRWRYSATYLHIMLQCCIYI